MKLRPLLCSLHHLRNVLCGAWLLIGAATVSHAQNVSIYNASFDGAGNNISGTTVDLNPFTVTGIFKYNAQVTVYISDGSGANGRIFSTSAFATLPTVGAQYTATVNTAVFQGTEEFTSPTNFTATGMLGAAAPVQTTVSQIASSVPFGGNPASGTYNAALTFAPVTFTITPTADGTLSTTGSTTVTDTDTGLSVLLYRSANATAFVAGTQYQVTGFEQPFNNASEIVGVYGFTATAVPEPGTWVLLAGGGLLLGGVARSRRTAA